MMWLGKGTHTVSHEDKANSVSATETDKKPIRRKGIYERTVGWITEWVKPSLHKITEDFTHQSVQELAPDNPRYAKMIEFEIRRRGDGAGLTQDVAEPLLWTGVKTGAALGVAAATESLKDGEFKMVGRFAALGIILNNGIELLRLVPRYRAGLQGSLEMAKDRWRSLETTGVDPFMHREQRMIADPKEAHAQALAAQTPDEQPKLAAWGERMQEAKTQDTTRAL
jgi:hypothetical protein